MMDFLNKLFISTIAEDAEKIIRGYHTGAEVSEFCTASNMDGADFTYWDGIARRKISCAAQSIFHAPFNELNPSAIDPKAVKLAQDRFNQAYRLASGYGIRRMVVHSGYIPQIYFKNWFHDRSVEFWKIYMADKSDDFFIMIENVLDDEPRTLESIAADISDPRVGICLDIGHANTMSDVPLEQWIDRLAPYTAHFHIHNNDKKRDMHWELGKGAIDMEHILRYILNKVPRATITIENICCEPSMLWLSEHGFLQ